MSFINFLLMFQRLNITTGFVQMGQMGIARKDVSLVAIICVMHLSFHYSFILNISIALLQGDYSGALLIPVRPKRKVFR